MKFKAYAKALIAASLMMGTAATAKEFQTLPILNGNFCPKPQVGLSMGYMNLKNVDTDGLSAGVEISFDCPIFTLPWDDLRQQIMLNRFDSNGLAMTNLEFNPYYIVTLKNGVEWGFGPGFGVIFADGGKSDTVWTFQTGTGLKMNLNKDYYAGADIRYQWSQKAEIAPGIDTTLDNYRALVKIGMRF